MFEVLVYVYENYWQGAACPESDRLGRRLTAAGFDGEEISAALVWLDGLNTAARSSAPGLADDTHGLTLSCTAPPGSIPQSAHSMRVYSAAEQAHLGAESLGFVAFLEASGVLPPHMREIVLDRAMAAPGGPIPLDDLKIIVLMVYWSFGTEPDALVLDELCDDAEGRLAH